MAMPSREFPEHRVRRDGASAESQLGLPEYRGHSRAEKIAFALLVLFILAAMAGLFGDGPLSTARVSSADGAITVEYQRFCRRQAPQRIDITLPTQRDAKQTQLTINGEYLRRVQITEIFPQPLASSRHEVGQLQFSTDGSGRPMTVRLHLQPQLAGSQQAIVTAGTSANASQARFEQFVYP
jgi:hypothetical protein